MTAESFASEMGGIFGAFITFSDKCGRREISQNPTGCIGKTNQVISLLSKRVAADERAFYPLAVRT